MTNVVVTGGAGYFGSVVVARLLQDKHYVTVIDSMLHGGEALIPYATHPRLNIIPEDVLIAPVPADTQVIIHLAALVGEDACKVNPHRTRKVNIDATKRMLECGPPVLYASTCSNYGVTSPEAEATEETPLNPISLYAETKVKSEQLCIKKPGGMVFRFGTLFGLSGRMRFDLLVNDLALRARTWHDIHIYAPDAWRPYMHVQDAASVLSWAVERTHTHSGGVYNAVVENLRKRHLVQMVKTHYPDAKIHITDKGPDRRDYRVDGSKLTKVFPLTEWSNRGHHTVDDGFCEVARNIALFNNPFNRRFKNA